jgi:hypothetical protein
MTRLILCLILVNVYYKVTFDFIFDSNCKQWEKPWARCLVRIGPFYVVSIAYPFTPLYRST